MNDKHHISLYLVMGCVLAATLILPVQTGTAQVRGEHTRPQRFSFEHLSVVNGLPVNTVRVTLQDEQGMLWFGTQNGLVKYDGYALTTYRPAPDSGSLVGNVFNTLHLDRNGDIWGGSCSYTLYQFDRETERFTSYRHRPDQPTLQRWFMCASLIHEDRAGDLWVIWNGKHLDKLDRTRDEVTHVLHDPTDPNSLSHDKVFALHEDREGALWLGTIGGGLNRLDPETGRYRHYRHDPANPQSVSSDSILAIYEPPSEPGVFYLGTAGGGLNRFDPTTGVSTRYRHDSEDPLSISSDSVLTIFEDQAERLWVGTRSGLCLLDREAGRFERFLRYPDHPGELGNSVRTVFEDRYGLLWLKTTSTTPGWPFKIFPSPYVEEGELFSFDPVTKTFTAYPYDNTDPVSLRGGKYGTGFFEDRQGIFWIGTWMSGLAKLDRSRSPFTAYRYNPLDPDALQSKYLRSVYEAPSKPGVLWLGASDGRLYRFDRSTERFRLIPLDGDLSTEPDRDGGTYHDKGGISSLYEAPSEPGALYIGTFGEGLYRLDIETERITHQYRYEEKETASLSSDIVTVILEDRKHTLWIGTQDKGINLLDRETGRFTHYQHDSENPNSLGKDNVITLMEDREGLLWVCLNGHNPNAFNPLTGRFTEYVVPSTIAPFYEDPSGRLWGGTYYGGLFLFDRAQGEFTPIFPPDHRYAQNWFNAMLGDEAGRLWLGTQNGLYRFDPDTDDFRKYDTGDGLPGIDLMARPIQTASGEFFFGGENGFVGFYPDAVEDNPYMPPIVLTGFKLFNEAVAISADTPLKAHISLAEEITLRHNENDFAFEFAALNYRDSEKNQYRYRLEPYETAWREAGTRREAAYTNMAPGEYTFRVIGSNNDSVWNEEGASFRLIILPPWWRTAWAYALYALLIAALAVGAFRLQRRRLLRNAEIEQAQLRADAAEMQSQAAESQSRALEAENERNRIEAEKGRELQTAYHTLKTTQAQLVQTEKMASLGQLTSGIAHELKNPLNFVNNFAELNEELARELIEELDQHRDQETLDDLAHSLKTNAIQIAKHGKRADRIVHAMMDHAQGGAGERYPVEVNAFVEEYVNLASHAAQTRRPDLHVAIERDYGEGVGNVEMVPQEMGRALLNVLGNAFEAVLERGGRSEETRARSATDASKGGIGYVPRVKVSTRRVDGKVEIRMCDHGPGIPAEIREKIFEPFFTTKPTGQGNTGLGLSLAYDIVTQGHGGTLTVESQEGEGATFIVTLLTK